MQKLIQTIKTISIMIKIIGLSGKSGSGKSLAAAMILQHLYLKKMNASYENIMDIASLNFLVNTYETLQTGWVLASFAGELKNFVCRITGCSLEDLENQEFKNQKLSEEWLKPLPPNNELDCYSYRKALTLIGTDLLRNQFHENIWVNALFNTNKDFNKIITDCRFKNEADAIIEKGGILIRLERNSSLLPTEAQQHSSEVDLDDYDKFTYKIFNNGTTDSLYQALKQILVNEKII